MFYMCYSLLAFKIPPLSKGNPTVYQQNGCQTEKSIKFPIKSNTKFKILNKKGSTRKTFSKLPIHPTPNQCFWLTCDLRAETRVTGDGVGRQFPRNLNWSNITSGHKHYTAMNTSSGIINFSLYKYQNEMHSVKILCFHLVFSDEYIILSFIFKIDSIISK